MADYRTLHSMDKREYTIVILFRCEKQVIKYLLLCKLTDDPFFQNTDQLENLVNRIEMFFFYCWLCAVLAVIYLRTLSI